MPRHPEYRFCIGEESEKDNWLVLRDLFDTGWEEDLYSWGYEGPLEFTLRIKEKTGWTITKLEHGQYRFAEDPLQLVYWWDDLFGFTITIPDWDKLPEAKAFLKEYTEDPHQKH